MSVINELRRINLEGDVAVVFHSQEIFGILKMSLLLLIQKLETDTNITPYTYTHQL